MDDNRSSLLSADSLSVGYGKKVVVSGVDITVNPGEIITLIGPNGSGKSTVLKSISAQLDLIGGKVILNGKDISAIKERDIAKQLSVMLTDRPDPELMTCREVVESGRYPYTNMLGVLSPDDRKTVSDAMKLTETTELSEKSFSSISDGQRQRIMLARSVCQQPDVLILDEPTSFLDIKHKLELLDILKKLVREKNTGVVMSLHELDLAMKISDKVICIKNNRVDRTGDVSTIFRAEYIEELYEVSHGTFNDIFGSTELYSEKKDPEVFVIGGGGSAVETYRSLQRMGIPFAAGVIHENDIEYPLAKALASSLITEKAFEPVSDETVNTALEILKKCSKVICTVRDFGTMNQKNLLLKEKAEECGFISDTI